MIHLPASSRSYRSGIAAPPGQACCRRGRSTGQLSCAPPPLHRQDCAAKHSRSMFQRCAYRSWDNRKLRRLCTSGLSCSHAFGGLDDGCRAPRVAIRRPGKCRNIYRRNITPGKSVTVQRAAAGFGPSVMTAAAGVNHAASPSSSLSSGSLVKPSSLVGSSSSSTGAGTSKSEAGLAGTCFAGPGD